MFLWPTNTKRITSKFRDTRKNHHGIDIAQSGTRPIYAAAEGTVSRSYTSTSYGECIFILHNINGQQWETVYAHMRTGSRKVKAGQSVKRGQTIGTMGNTGHSTGQHLHFELHRGRWNINKTNAVDPLKYLNKGGTSSSPSTGGYIKDIQKWVGTTVDGIAGPKTWAKLTKKLQSELNKQYNAGLKVDGVWGPKTKAAVVTIRNGAKGNLTRVMQSALYLSGNTEVGKPDGIYGKNTRKALGNFQRANNLTVDHAAGRKTFAKLFG